MKKLQILLAALAIVGALVACGGDTDAPELTLDTALKPTQTAFAQDRTAYGFYPSPPDATFESVLNHFVDLGEHADFILTQPNIPWKDFVDGLEGESKARTDLRNQVLLARRNGLDWVFVVDPLNGLNRREFLGLPNDWNPSFANPDVRAAFMNFTLWIVREFDPSYLGLASEINTYFDAHPDDIENYMSLYFEVYDRVKTESSETQIFVTFQWDDLNNMFAPVAEGRPAYQINWNQVEAFEPKLDLWAFASYPYFVFEDGQIPTDYYTPLIDKTDKPLAVAEGGWSSAKVGPVGGSEAGQVAYLEAVHDQLGEHLTFWVYLVLDDFKIESIGVGLEEIDRLQEDVEMLRLFGSIGLRTSDGIPKPALTLWEQYRQAEP